MAESKLSPALQSTWRGDPMRHWIIAIVLLLVPGLAGGFVLDGLQNNDTLKECLVKSNVVIAASVADQPQGVPGAEKESYLLNLIVDDVLFENNLLPRNLVPKKNSTLQFVLPKGDEASLNQGDRLIVLLKVGYSKLPYYEFSDQRFGIQKYSDSLAASIKKAYQEKNVIKFGGEVKKGQAFEKQVREDLFFRLISQESGWTISLGSKTDPQNNFASVVTPPYHGINSLDIQGWHLRNSDNTGPNEVGPKNVNAPQELREFSFVLSDADYDKAFDALSKMLWSYSYSDKEVKAAEEIQEKLSKGEGRLTIRNWTGNNLEAGKQAGMDSITFDVELDFP